MIQITKKYKWVCAFLAALALSCLLEGLIVLLPPPGQSVSIPEDIAIQVYYASEGETLS